MISLFLYQSDTETFFQCPACEQNGAVNTQRLDAALHDNPQALIICTYCDSRFEPHAPAAASLLHHEAAAEPPSDEIAQPQKTQPQKTPPRERADVPDLKDIWQQYQPQDNAATAKTAASFPAWLSR